jgi:hypothetical protein
LGRFQCRRRVVEVAQTELDFPGSHEAADTIAVRGLKPQLNTWMIGSEYPEPFQQRGAGKRAHHGERHGAAVSIHEFRDGVRPITQVGKHPQRKGEKRLTRVGQPDASSQTLEQCRPELHFQQIDSATDCRLGDTQFVDCPGEGAVVHDGDEGLDLNQFHIHQFN